MKLPLELPTRDEWAAAAATAILLILSFPDFEFSFLAWIALVPLMWAVVQHPSPSRALILGWAASTVFFYGSCSWLSYSMIHYGGLSTVLAYSLVLLPTVVVGFFTGLFALLLALAVKKWGHLALLLAPVLWAAFEWLRLIITGQLWNALGYSQAYHPAFIQPAKWGGVYAVSFLIVTVNTAIVFVLLKQTLRALALAALVVILVGCVNVVSSIQTTYDSTADDSAVHVIALQPNVPMSLAKSPEELTELMERHWSMSRNALASLPNDDSPRFLIWPESPMNFTYAPDEKFQQQLATFTKENRTSLLFNSLEPTLNNGFYNSALLINEEGRLISQYDKIRLMPFGEYVPLPQWLPGASLITGIVGDFTPGEKYTLMPFGYDRAGTFICIESAYPWIARRLTSEGADVLINISNDGYLGPTAVMRQHLANVVFRAVENGRPVLRVTNTGITARIDPRGIIYDQTVPFQTDVRVWSVKRSSIVSTFYTRHGDVFVYACMAITVLAFVGILLSSRRSFRQTNE
ncbi:MAG TPA: apolipoprotein N-acyltransferase [Pyrinomonadaceae bacterium]|nr:apolipoprotein N-acyltransferase [Pyrinomonadaceae bacterium]